MTLLIYVIKVNLILCLVYALYRLFMKYSGLHQLNRFFLALSPLLIMILPFLRQNSVNARVFSVALPEVSVDSSVLSHTYSSYTYLDALILIWVLGALISLTSLAKRMKTLRHLLKSDNSNLTFTFLRKIRLSEELKGDIRDKVMMHEKVHARELHTIDIIWYEVLRIMFWFNPLIKLMQNELKEVHEYAADNIVNKRSENYPETLLALTLGVSNISIISEFQGVNIKKRIKMMNMKKNKFKTGLVAGSLALVIASSALISWTTVNNESSIITQHSLFEVDKKPVFSGCETGGPQKEVEECSNSKLMKFMINEVNYPPVAKEQGIQGKVFVKFIVSAEGKVINSQVVKGVSEDMDKEALRVVNAMPKWTPGQKDGKNVDVEMVIPLLFKLE